MSDIYFVVAQDVDKDYPLGYAKGSYEDVMEYFSPQKRCGLELKKIQPVEVTHQMAIERKNAARNSPLYYPDLSIMDIPSHNP